MVFAAVHQNSPNRSPVTRVTPPAKGFAYTNRAAPTGGLGTMGAYFISDPSVKNVEALDMFRARALASITHYGGRYLARAGLVEPIEGTWTPSAIIIIEFPDLERAKIWYRSTEYATALAVRDEAISRRMILVEGMP